MTVRDLIHERADRYVDWLFEACSIPSLAEDPDGLATMADWVQARFEEQGATVERLGVAAAPEVLLARVGSGDRTVLVYDHYDVQPVDPIELWDSKPFDPDLRDGILYARGVADNKGDLVARLAALEIYRDTFGELPVALKFLVEGEEEVGSKHFGPLVARYGDKFAADGCIWEGAGIDHAGRPELVFGAKGLAYVELTCRGLKDDQHSSVAVIAPSPAWRLVEALATLRDPDGRVLIDGFYDDVVPPTDEDIEMMRNLPFDESAERERLGVEEFVGGDSGLELLERLLFQPTCNIAGIVSGFIVPGASKTVLPKEAMAKVDMRLVPNQDPADIVAKLKRHLAAHGYEDLEVTQHSMESPVRSPADSLIARAAVKAAQDVYDAQPPAIAPVMIGTGPMHHIAGTLGIPTVSPAGVCRPESLIHAPNENVRVEDFVRTIEYTIAWIRAVAEASAS